MYLIQKNINKLYQDGNTFFLNPQELKEITHHLKKNSFNVYKPHPFSEKNLLYTDNIPPIILLEIIISVPIRHQDILGSLFHLGIDEHLFGDIIISHNHYYFYTFSNMKPFFEIEFTKIKNNSITLIEQDLNYLENYQPSFEEITIITSSLRIDSVIAKIIHTNRETIKDLIHDKKILYNYEILKDNSKGLQIGDTFSIRKYGKYQFNSIISNTKKNNLIIKILKYSNNEKN